MPGELTMREAAALLAEQIQRPPAALLYGPDGRPLMASSDRAGLEAVGKSGAWAMIEDAVNKTVRNQATSLTQIWDPQRGKPKPTSITYDTLRMMSNRNEWAAAIIKTRINQIGKAKWSITPKDPQDTSSSTKRMCDQVADLLHRPSLHGSRPNSRSWRQFIGEVLRDILVLDQGVIEKERNHRKWIVAMYPVDGATIQPNIDEKGGYGDDAYVQLVDGQVTARFGIEDLIVIMDNPQTDVRFAGYGFSPMEWLIMSVSAELYSSKYNASYFEKGAVPEGMINLGEDVAPEDLDAFRLYWVNEIMGKPWSIPIVGGKGVQWIPWRNSNKDMEFQAYQEWLLKKMCAVYQIPPQEVGELEDVNRSTAQEQATTNTTKSLEPVKTLIQDFFEVEVIGEYGLGLGDYIQFKFDEEPESEDAIDQRYSLRVQAGAATRNEWREKVNLEPAEDPGADMLLVAGQLVGLPTPQDIAVSGAAAQQQQQQQQQMQQQGAGPGTMPWKPADPNDPDVQAAQADHQLNHGAGPVEPQPVAKVAPDGRDRNPSLTEVHDNLEQVFERASTSLLDRLERLVGFTPAVTPAPVLDDDPTEVEW